MSWDSSIDSAIRLLYISGIAVTFYRYCCSGVFDRPNTIHNGDFCVVKSNPCQRKRCSHSHSSKGAAKVRRGSRSFRICLGAFIPPVMTNQSDISWSRTLLPSSNVLSYLPFRVAPDGLRSRSCSPGRVYRAAGATPPLTEIHRDPHMGQVRATPECIYTSRTPITGLHR